MDTICALFLVKMFKLKHVHETLDLNPYSRSHRILVVPPRVLASSTARPSLLVSLLPERLQPLLLRLTVDPSSDHKCDEIEERNPCVLR